MEVTSKDELMIVLSSFKKDGNPRPYGWLMVLSFFELTGDDLLRVVEEVRKHGKVFSEFNATFLATIPK
jgi:hypothetical protein